MFYNLKIAKGFVNNIIKMTSENYSSHIKTVAHYLKSDFPDQRFLPFRLYIHNKTEKDTVPDFKYFESFYQHTNMKKKKIWKLSPIKSNRIFENKEKLYCQMFTNGNVNIRNEYSGKTTKNKSKSPLYSKAEEKLDLIAIKARSTSQKKNNLDMMVDSDKKQGIISSRKLKRKIINNIEN